MVWQNVSFYRQLLLKITALIFLSNAKGIIINALKALPTPCNTSSELRTDYSKNSIDGILILSF